MLAVSTVYAVPAPSQDPELALRWLKRVTEQARKVRELQGELAVELAALDRDLLVASRLIGVSDLAKVCELSRPTIYKSIDRAQSRLNVHERAALVEDGKTNER